MFPSSGIGIHGDGGRLVRLIGFGHVIVGARAAGWVGVVRRGRRDGPVDQLGDHLEGEQGEWLV